MKKTVLFGILIALYALLMIPNISAIEYHEVQKENPIDQINRMDIESILQLKKITNLNDGGLHTSFIESSIFQNIVDILVFLFTTFFKIVGSIISISADIFGFIISIVASIIGSIISIVAQIIGSIISILASLIGPMIRVIFSVIGKIVGIIFKIIGVIIPLLGKMINGIAQVIGTIFETIGRFIDLIVTFLFSNNIALSTVS